MFRIWGFSGTKHNDSSLTRAVQTDAVTQQRVGEVGPSMAGKEGMDGQALQQLATFPGNCCSFFFFALYTTWPSHSVKQDQHLRVCALQRALPLNPRGPLARVRGGMQPATAVRLLLLPLHGRPLPQQQQHSVVSPWPTFLR